MTDSVLPLTAVEFDPQNARQRTERSSGMIRKSLEKFGPLRSLVGQRLPDGRIIVRAGNGTLEEAGQIGIDKVRIIERRPDELVVVVADDLDESAWKSYAIADNRSSDLSEWDTEILAELAKEIPMGDWFSDVEMGDWGIEEAPDWDTPSDEDDEETTADLIDEAEQGQIESRVKPGEIWALGRHRICCGDSTDEGNVRKLLGGKTVDLLFTSPPYSDMRDYEDGIDVSIEKIASFIPAWSDHVDYFAVNLGLKFADGEIVPYWQKYIDIAKNCGLKLLAWNVWDKTEAERHGNASRSLPGKRINNHRRRKDARYPHGLRLRAIP